MLYELPPGTSRDADRHLLEPPRDAPGAQKTTKPDVSKTRPSNPKSLLLYLLLPPPLPPPPPSPPPPPPHHPPSPPPPPPPPSPPPPPPPANRWPAMTEMAWKIRFARLPSQDFSSRLSDGARLTDHFPAIRVSGGRILSKKTYREQMLTFADI